MNAAVIKNKCLNSMIYGVLLSFLILPLFAQVHAHEGCGTDDIHKHLMDENPEYRQKYDQQNQEIRDFIQRKQAARGIDDETVYTIPVVVHVIHLGEAIGTGSNVSDFQITEAIRGMNERFRNIIGNGADIQLEFCLASRDPDGNPTNGINRVDGRSVPLYQSGGIKRNVEPTCDNLAANDPVVKDLSKWPVSDYYNIWVVHKICGGWGGYAYYPNGSSYDGTVIVRGAMAHNDITLAHEVGHGFNLPHTFNGDGGNSYCPENSDCLTQGDFVCDTPPHKQGDCGSSNPCSGSGIWNNSRYNYMSYCFPSANNARFTQGQKERIRATLNVYPRADLLNSLGCASPIGNEISLVEIVSPPAYVCGGENIPGIKVSNLGSSVVTSLKVVTKLNNNESAFYDWTGNLNPGAEEIITLPVVYFEPDSNRLYIEVSEPNGQADNFQSNNFKMKTVFSDTPSDTIGYSFEDGIFPPVGTRIYNQDGGYTWDIANVACGGNVARINSFKGNINALNSTDDIILPPVDLSGYREAELVFKVSHKVSYSNTHGTLSIIANGCDTGSDTLFSKTGSQLATVGGYDIDNAWVPVSCNQWRTEMVNLNQYVGDIIRISLKYMISSYNTQNLYIDSIFIRGIKITGCEPEQPEILIYGETSFCSGDSIKLETNQTGVAYQWFRNNVSIVGAVTNAYTITQSGTYSLITYNDCGSSPQSEDIVVNVQKPITKIIASDTFNCSGNIVLTASGGISYLWNTGDSISSIEVSPEENTMYEVWVSDELGCKGHASIEIKKCPKDFITLWDLAHSGSGATQIQFFADILSGGASYTWQTYPDGEIKSGVLPAGNNLKTISGLPENSIIVLSITPKNLKRFYMYHFGDKLRIVDVLEWGTAEWSSMQRMFYDCANLNISALDTPQLKHVTDMSWMFSGASSFNQPIGHWSTENIGDMSYVFFNANSFNRSLSNWNVSNVINMYGMFGNAMLFNQPIGNWDVSNVKDMGNMFLGAGSFNQSIGNWELNSDVNMIAMLNASGMDCQNYSQTLIGWAENPNTPTGRNLVAAGRRYAPSAISARNQLLSKGWTINDNGLNNTCGCETFIATIDTLGTTTFCQGDSVALIASAGDSYIWNTGDTSRALHVTSSGTYRVTVTKDWCTATSDFINVSVIPGYSDTISTSICFGQSYSLPDGSQVSTAGTYSVRMQSSAGCDSIVTTVLNVITVMDVEIRTSVCSGQSYTLPDGSQVSAAGTYPVILPSAAGCDSIITTVLTVNEILETNIETSICNGQAYTLPDGSQVSAAGTYPVTLPSSVGCDSIVTTVLTVNEILEINIEANICRGQVYALPDGSQVSVAGTYPVTLSSAAGCDSIVTTVLTVNEILATNIEASICSGQVYILPDGSQVSASGTYPVTLESSTGCDSIVTTVLTVNDILETNIEANICGGQSYTLPDGSEVGTAGTYPVTLLSSAGCDSIVTTVLTVNDILETNIEVSICSGQTYTLPDGSQVSTAGTYPVTLLSSTGCDSIVTTVLTVNNILETNIEANICSGQTYTLSDGSEVSASGTYPVTLPSSVGCDSIITTVLTVNDILETNIETNICGGQSYTLPDGSQASAAGTYPVTLESSTGCDSIVTTVLTVNDILETNIEANICGGQTYTLSDGSQVSASGTYPVTLESSTGCDSIVTTVLTVNDILETNIEANICSGQTYTLSDGSEVSASGTYPVTLPSSVGCDSIITTVLTVNDILETNIETNICGGQSYTLPDGTQVSTAGTYPVTLLSSTGCDSIITTVLTVHEILETNIEVSICGGQSHTLPDGTQVSASGTYPLTLPSSAGCDSIVTIVLTVNDILETNIEANICGGQSYTLPDGSEVGTAGTYPVTLESSIGCDSIVTTVLTVNDILETSIEANICSGQTYTLPDGSQVSASGTYPVTLPSSTGCDSIVTTVLTVADIITTTVNVEICSGASYALPDGNVVSASGYYPITVTASNGCDSVVTTNLTVLPLPEKPVITQSGIILSSDYPDGNQWYLNGTVINGANQQEFEINSIGIYTVTYTDANGCSSTSDALEILTVSVDEKQIGIEAFRIYPNPNDGYFTIELESTKGGDATLEIVNVLGQVVSSKQLNNLYGKQTIQTDLSEHGKGIYFVNLYYNNEIINRRVVVQ